MIPSLSVIVVRFGATLAETGHNPRDFHEPYRLYLFEPLMEAITDPHVKPAPRRNSSAIVAPYPPSPIIARLDWAPTNSIVWMSRRPRTALRRAQRPSGRLHPPGSPASVRR